MQLTDGILTYPSHFLHIWNSIFVQYDMYMYTVMNDLSKTWGCCRMSMNVKIISAPMTWNTIIENMTLYLWAKECLAYTKRRQFMRVLSPSLCKIVKENYYLLWSVYCPEIQQLLPQSQVANTCTHAHAGQKYACWYIYMALPPA